jgi:DNA polymerase family A
MSEPIYIDTETCGLCGPAVLIQYAIGEGEIRLHEVWKSTFNENLNLLERFAIHKDGLVFFNASFDWFMVQKLYSMFSLFLDRNSELGDETPEDYINELGLLEADSRDQKCIKPIKVCDIMIVARRTKYQSLMERSDIRIKKVPVQLAQPLCEELEKRIQLNEIYFARRKDKYAPKWRVEEIADYPEFRNIVLKFKASSGLKNLAIDALGIKDEILLWDDVSLDKSYFPVEFQFAPFCTAVAPDYLKTRNWANSWPSKIKSHIIHWEFDKDARKYAIKDVEYTRALYHYFGSPELGDNNSTLACATASIRWKGYAIDSERIKKLKKQALKEANEAPKDPNGVRNYILPELSLTERLIIKNSTKRVILEEIAKYEDDPCECNVSSNCILCGGKGTIPNKAAIKAKKVLLARKAKKKVEVLIKLELAGRFHAAFNVSGTLSDRMSGSGKLNAQGISKTKDFRSCFPLAHSDQVLCGGDFESFEIAIADSVYDDPELRKQLLTIIDCPFCQGKGCKECNETGKHRQTLHGLFGTFLYPGKTYLDILLTKGTSDDLYTKSKSAVFTKLYNGTPFSMKERLGIPIEQGQKADEMFESRFRKVAIERKKVNDRFQSMRQVGGIGSKIEWNEPAEYVESIFGYRRYFNLENQICKILFDLAEKPPKSWTSLKINVIRRDREQSVSGAVRSALFAAAFQIQSAASRAAGNHLIQSSGATITKALQCDIWSLQPSGISDWIVMPLNIHDEIKCPSKPDMVSKIKNIVDIFVKEYKKKVPLIEIDWSNKLNSWADK